MRWTRRELLISSSAVVSGLWRVVPLAAQTGQQPPVPSPAMVFTPLRGNTGVFIGQGGTIGWLVSPDGVVVVDAQMPVSAKACLDGLNERSSGRRIDALFNTHHHGDHTGGNGVFRPAVKTIVAHARVPELQKATAKPGTEADLVLADTTFTDRWSLKLGAETITAAHYGAAHTGGDSVVTFTEANVVHMGDLVFNRRMPVLDRPGGCRIAAWAVVLEKVAAERPSDAIYVFGHAKPGLGPTGSRADLLLQRDFLTALLLHVRAQVTAGRSKEEIVKASAELKGFAEHGPLTERVLTSAWEEVTEASS